MTNVPVMTTLAGKSAFPEDHPLALGTAASSGTLMCAQFLQKTDFILGMGSSLTISNFNAPMPSGVTVAHSTNCAEDVNKDYRAQYGAIGDAKVVLRQMIEEAKSQLGEHGRGDVHGVRDEIAKVKAQWMEDWSPSLNSDEVPISPYRVFTELMKAVDVRETIITHDSGYPREQLVPFWPAVTPRNYIGWGKSTQLGYGLGLALGAKMAAPEKQVINIMGDAAFGMSGLDIETATRSEITHPDGGAQQRRHDPLRRHDAVRDRALGQQRARGRVRRGRSRTWRLRRKGLRPRRDGRCHPARPCRQPRGQASPP